MDLVDYLMKTGLTKHESKIYISLCKYGEMTGYEVAKLTKIPRANIYQALAGLVEKGGAYVIEGSVQKYISVPVSEYCNNYSNEIKNIIDKIQKLSPSLIHKSQPYITISGFKHILNKIKNIINDTKERIYISIPHGEINYFVPELLEAVRRNIKVVLITSKIITLDGVTLYITEKQPGQIRLISDTTHVLTGEIAGNESDTCLYSKNKPLIQLVKGALENEIKLAVIPKKRTEKHKN